MGSLHEERHAREGEQTRGLARGDGKNSAWCAWAQGAGGAQGLVSCVAGEVQKQAWLGRAGSRADLGLGVVGPYSGLGLAYVGPFLGLELG